MIWEKSCRRIGLDGSVAYETIGFYRHLHRLLQALPAVLLLLISTSLPAHGKKHPVHYGAGLIVNIPLPEPEVEQAVEDVVQNTIIRGTKEYNKDPYVSGAVAVASTPVFPKWTQGGKVFYKVRLQALDPVNFKDSADVGTLAVRYVVRPQGDKNTILKIDAVFVEDFRRSAHASDGSVERSECQDIQDHLAQVELVKKETADALQAKQDRANKGHSNQEKFSTSKDTVGEGVPPSTAVPAESMHEGSVAGESTTGEKTEAEAPVVAEANTAGHTEDAVQPLSYEQKPGETLEQHVAELRQEVERVVKKPGAPLQSAPFHTATTVKSLEAGAEVMVLITTSYWYGVETRDGEHGWIRRDLLEQLP